MQLIGVKALVVTVAVVCLVDPIFGFPHPEADALADPGPVAVPVAAPQYYRGHHGGHHGGGHHGGGHYGGSYGGGYGHSNVHYHDVVHNDPYGGHHHHAVPHYG